MPPQWMPRARLDDFLQHLQQLHYEIMGPTIADGAITYGPIRQLKDLPVGWTDEQAPGHYRLRQCGDDRIFGYVVGPHSWKKYLFPSRLRLWEIHKQESGWKVQPNPSVAPKRAFLGMRACELHAMQVQDRVFLHRDGQVVDPHYETVRNAILLIAVECTVTGANCFCTSMGTGPAVVPPLDQHRAGSSASPTTASRRPLPMAKAAAETPATFVDIVLTELAEGFVVRVESDLGHQVLASLSLETCSADRLEQARLGVEQAAAQMSKRLDARDVQGLLHRNQEHPRWHDVAQRCLGCTNCTMVCPTCFCASVEEVTDLSLQSSARERVWDSCFNPDFAYVHGGNFRPSLHARYRQWLTHKFATWWDQFDVSGCVGCGRCITWCPVGIDVVEEIKAIQTQDGFKQPSPGGMKP